MIEEDLNSWLEQALLQHFELTAIKICETTASTFQSTQIYCESLQCPDVKYILWQTKDAIMKIFLMKIVYTWHSDSSSSSEITIFAVNEISQQTFQGLSDVAWE